MIERARELSEVPFFNTSLFHRGSGFMKLLHFPLNIIPPNKYFKWMFGFQPITLCIRNFLTVQSRKPEFMHTLRPVLHLLSFFSLTYQLFALFWILNSAIDFTSLLYLSFLCIIYSFPSWSLLYPFLNTLCNISGISQEISTSFCYDN